RSRTHRRPGSLGLARLDPRDELLSDRGFDPVTGGRAEHRASDRIDLGRPPRLAVFLHRRSEVGWDGLDPREDRLDVQLDTLLTGNRDPFAEARLEPTPPGGIRRDAAKRRFAERRRQGERREDRELSPEDTRLAVPDRRREACSGKLSQKRLSLRAG